MMHFQDIVYSNRKNHENIHENIIEYHQKIEGWFRNQWLKYPAPFYSSIDIRNSGFKISPVDTNLFPAGFNNLNKDFESAKHFGFEGGILSVTVGFNTLFWFIIPALSKVVSTALIILWLA